ncbi:MAG: hypothetical protein Q4E75_03430 [bacterium]|nr:hypothetical protein [bacterium]
MKIDSVIHLKNQESYLLLLQDKELNGKYFLAVLLDQDNNPTDKYEVFMEDNKDGRLFVKKVRDEEILKQLLIDYQKQYNSEI